MKAFVQLSTKTRVHESWVTVLKEGFVQPSCSRSCQTRISLRVHESWVTSFGWEFCSTLVRAVKRGWECMRFDKRPSTNMWNSHQLLSNFWPCSKLMLHGSRQSNKCESLNSHQFFVMLKIDEIAPQSRLGCMRVGRNQARVRVWAFELINLLSPTLVFLRRQLEINVVPSGVLITDLLTMLDCIYCGQAMTTDWQD